jgi:lysophospholipase L1-like esterase
VQHLVLLGDSIFDNGRYVPGGPAVIGHVRRMLPAGWQATLGAVDGAIASDVARQLARLPADATHLVVSVGGNDALERAGPLLHAGADSFAEALTEMGRVREGFRRDYRTMLDGVRAVGLPVCVCTIYDAIPGLAEAERAGLALFNDVIFREAFVAGVPVIDLRLVCAEATDYATTSPIEPSVAGGGKIARAVIRAVLGYGPKPGEGQVFT